MAGNVVRIGDKISCGDNVAGGSSTVFMGGMPVSVQGGATTGHGCFPPTVFAGPFSTSVFVNNKPVAIKGKTAIVPHRCGRSVHDGVAVSGAGTVYIEA